VGMEGGCEWVWDFLFYFFLGVIFNGRGGLISCMQGKSYTCNCALWLQSHLPHAIVH
jgi:hypothetical protein